MEEQPMPFRKASIKGTETRVLRSQHTKKKYLISLGLPHRYPNEPERKWPVVYLLDANFFFGMTTEIVRVMSWCGSTQDAIVVGIGYATDKPPAEAWRQIMAWRANDLTPERDEAWENRREDLPKVERTGGGEQFFRFIKEELIPLVETDYRINPKERTLAGHSLGGLLALYAMLWKPGLFKYYVVGSPSLYWRDELLFEDERRFSRRRKTLPAYLYLTIGESEGRAGDDPVTRMLRFSKQLDSRNYGRFMKKERIFAGEDHCTVAVLGFQAGLKFALEV
jgi:predicted alpha/beta superfamily hydrolase